MSFHAQFSENVFGLQICVTFLSLNGNKRTAGNLFGCKLQAACQSTGVFICQHLVLIFSTYIHTFELAAKVLNDLLPKKDGVGARADMYNTNLIFLCSQPISKPPLTVSHLFLQAQPRIYYCQSKCRAAEFMNHLLLE